MLFDLPFEFMDLDWVSGCTFFIAHTIFGRASIVWPDVNLILHAFRSNRLSLL